MPSRLPQELGAGLRGDKSTSASLAAAPRPCCARLPSPWAPGMVQPLPSFRQRAAGSRGPLAVSGRAWSLAPHASFPPAPGCAGRGAGGARPGQEWGPGARSFGAAARGSLRQLLPRSGGFGVIPLAGYTHGTGTCSVPVLLRGCALGAGCCSPGRPLGPHATPSYGARWCPGSGGPVPGAVVLCSGGRTHGKACREEPGASGELSWAGPFPSPCSAPVYSVRHLWRAA